MCCEGVRGVHNHWNLRGRSRTIVRRCERSPEMNGSGRRSMMSISSIRFWCVIGSAYTWRPNILLLRCLTAQMGSMALAGGRLMILAMSDGHYSIYALCAMCYSNLNPSRILYHFSYHVISATYHVISARGRNIHPGTVRRVSNKCLTMRDLTPGPSLVINYVFVAAAGKYICLECYAIHMFF